MEVRPRASIESFLHVEDDVHRLLILFIAVLLEQLEQRRVFSDEAMRYKAILLYTHKLHDRLVHPFGEDPREDLVVVVE